MKEVITSKIMWAASLTSGGVAITVTPDEWKIFWGAIASIVGAVAGACWKWHNIDMKKRRRMNGENGKGDKCNEDKND